RAGARSTSASWRSATRARTRPTGTGIRAAAAPAAPGTSPRRTRRRADAGRRGGSGDGRRPGGVPGQVVLDVDADDLVEVGLRAKAEPPGAARVEGARPAGDDARDRLVGL